MLVKKLFAFFLVLILRSSASESVRMPDECKSLLFRTTGRRNGYVITCRCGEGNSSRVLARVFTNDLTDLTLKQDRATIRCLRKREKILTNACIRGAKAFRKRGRRALNKCQSAPSSKLDRKIRNPRKVNQKKCSSRSSSFASEITKEFATVVICTCQQPRFEVVPGFGIFFTTGAPVDPSREVSKLRGCLNKAVAQLEEVCRNTPGDFELLSQQLLQVCCKRARRLFDDEKLQCSTAVPDDIAIFKGAFLL